MRHLMLVAMVVLSVGCKSERTQACREAAAAVAAKADEGMKKVVADRIEHHCRADRWSAEAIECAKTASTYTECHDKLTPAQQKALEGDAPVFKDLPLPPAL